MRKIKRTDGRLVIRVRVLYWSISVDNLARNSSRKNEKNGRETKFVYAMCKERKKCVVKNYPFFTYLKSKALATEINLHS